MDAKIKAQVSIWIVVGIILVASILIYFLLIGRAKLGISQTTGSSENVQSYIQGCVKDYVNEAE